MSSKAERKARRRAREQQQQEAQNLPCRDAETTELAEQFAKVVKPASSVASASAEAGDAAAAAPSANPARVAARARLARLQARREREAAALVQSLAQAQAEQNEASSSININADMGGDDEEAASAPFRVELIAPACSIRHLIGKQHASINAWRATRGIRSITLQHPSNPNHPSLLTIEADTALALAFVHREAELRIQYAERKLANGSRQLHSNVPKAGRPDSFIRSSAEVHQMPRTHKPAAARAGAPFDARAKRRSDAEHDKEKARNQQLKFKREHQWQQ